MTAWWLINFHSSPGGYGLARASPRWRGACVKLEFEQARLHIGQPAAMSVKLTVPSSRSGVPLVTVQIACCPSTRKRS